LTSAAVAVMAARPFIGNAERAAMIRRVEAYNTLLQRNRREIKWQFNSDGNDNDDDDDSRGVR